MMDVLLNVAVGLVTGVLTCIITLAGDRWLQARRLRQLHARLEGVYQLFPQQDGPPTDEVVEVRYAGDGVVNIRATCPRWTWVSVIQMSERNPAYGDGVFRYEGDHGWGEHAIHYNAADRSISVFVRRVTHSADYRPSLYVLRRPRLG
jgi:hypothetical protein